MKLLSKMQAFFQNRPITLGVFALIVSRIAGLGTIALIQLVNPALSIQEEIGWLLMLIYATVIVSLVYWANMADKVGLRKPTSVREWFVMVPLLVLPLLIVLKDGISSWGFTQNIVLLIAAFGVAINEEILFRGLFLRGFMKWGPWVAILVPSILFALIHATNVFAGGNVEFAVYQTIWTCAAGVTLSAMRLRNNSIYPVIVFHIILDLVEYFSTGEYGVHSEAISTLWLQLFAFTNLALAVYALYLFYRKFKQNSLQQRVDF